MSGCDSHDKFKIFFNQVQRSKDTMKLDEDAMNSYELSLFYEQFKIEVVNHAADNTTFLSTNMIRGM